MRRSEGGIVSFLCVVLLLFTLSGWRTRARIGRDSQRVPKDLAALARALTGRHSGCWGIWLSKASPAAEMSGMLHRRHGKRSLAFHSQNENNSPTW